MSWNQRRCSGAALATPALLRRWCGQPRVVDHHLWYAICVPWRALVDQALDLLLLVAGLSLFDVWRARPPFSSYFCSTGP